MNQEQETPQGATCGESVNQSPINQQPPVTPDKQLSPQEKKQKKVVECIKEITGCEFPFIMAAMVHDAVRTGLRVTDKEEEENKGYPIHCNAEYHFIRMTGPGRDLVPLLYAVSMHIAAESENFHIRLQQIARFLGVREETLYASANLLVAAGFWEVIERRLGAATEYRPVGHKDWAEKCGTEDWWDAAKQQYVKVGKYCTVKAQFPFQENSPEYLLGKKLHGITGEKYFNGVLTGWLKLAPTETLLVWAKAFMLDDAGAGDGIQRRIRLGKHFKVCAARNAI